MSLLGRPYLDRGAPTAYDRRMPSEKTALRVYVTDDEHEELKARAEQAQLSVSTYAHRRLFETGLSVELRAVLADHHEQLQELTAWHERSKAERAAWEARGWRSPLSLSSVPD